MDIYGTLGKVLWVHRGKSTVNKCARSPGGKN